jgi:hypothetical protein
MREALICEENREVGMRVLFPKMSGKLISIDGGFALIELDEESKKLLRDKEYMRVPADCLIEKYYTFHELADILKF